MSELLMKDVVVHDGEGRSQEARLYLCECGCQHFCLYAIPSAGMHHMHYQCLCCGTSYCTGEGVCGQETTDGHG